MADTSRKSTLKVWKITGPPVLGLSSSIGVECPHKDCKGKAVVNRRKWLGGMRDAQALNTRACTYCFRASWVTAAAKEKHDRGK